LMPSSVTTKYPAARGQAALPAAAAATTLKVGGLKPEFKVRSMVNH
jgi:hypothetical protein